LGNSKAWSAARLNTWTIVFLHYINDIMKITNTNDTSNKSKLVLFADDARLIITSPNSTDFIKEINGAFTNMNLLTFYTLEAYFNYTAVV